MRTQTKVILVLVFFSVVEIAPFPVLGLVGLYIAIKRPAWFARTVQQLYEEE